MGIATGLVHIVSVDDRVRCAVEAIMESLALPFASFDSAAECMACMQESAPDCVILDTLLADTNGLEFQQRLAIQGVPLVFVTREGDIPTSVRAIKAGALDFLTLPVQPLELLRSVRAALDLSVNARLTRQRSSSVRERFEKLTPREQEVLRMLLSGLATKQIAGRLGISDITAQVHRRRVMQKMGARSLPDLIHRGDMLGIEPCPGMRSYEPVEALVAATQASVTMHERTLYFGEHLGIQ